MSDKIGSILFKPTCSNCGRVIDGNVKYRFCIDYAMIAPSACPHCGCVFESVVMPNPTNSEIFHYDEAIYKPYSEISMGDF